jgi:hypothetical protein
VKLIYHPGGGDRQEFPGWDPNKLLSPEAELIEDIGGETWDNFEEFGAAFLRGKRKAIRAALWIMLRRGPEKPPPFRDFVIGVQEAWVAWDDTELSRFRELLADPEIDMDPEQREHLLATFAGDAPETAAPEDGGPLGLPSEPQPETTGTGSGEPGTGGPSVTGSTSI